MRDGAKRALAAHTRREAGDSWEQIAQDLGYKSARSLKNTVRKYARQHGWAWPLDDTSGVPIAGFTSHSEAAYHLREQGLKWHEVGARLGLTSPNADTIAYRYAKKHAARAKVLWPPPVPPAPPSIVPEGGKEAYDYRSRGMGWVEIRTRTGLGGAARSRAKRYAKITGLPWPIRFKTMGERAYEIKRDNPDMGWKEVARQSGYSFGSHACAGARRHAMRLAKEWLHAEERTDGTEGRFHAFRMAMWAVSATGAVFLLDADQAPPEALVEEARSIMHRTRRG